MSNEFKKSLEALLEVNDKDEFKGLKGCKLGTQAKPLEVFQKKEKWSYESKKNILENYQSCILSPRIGPRR